MKNKIDIIIPTFNRPDYLKRILNYYTGDRKGFNFIVADSSKAANKKINKKIVNSFKEMKILYVDNLPDTLSQHLKFAEMVKYAKAKYCVICADDDFTIPEAIRKCVDFLEKNPDYISVHGTYMGFHLQKNIINRLSFWWKPRYSPPTISSQEALKRLSFHLENFTQVTFSVRRTKELQHIYREFKKTGISLYLLPNFGELIPDMLTIIYGKVKSLNLLYSCRQYFGSVTGYYPSFYDARAIGKFDEDYQKFKKCILENISKRTTASEARAERILDYGFEKYMNLSYQEHFMNRINLLLRSLPAFFAESLRSLHALYLFSKNKDSEIGIIDQPSSRYYQDFLKVKNLVLNTK